MNVQVINKMQGRGPASGQTGGCLGELQGRPRGPHEEHSSISVKNRKLRLLRLVTLATISGPATIRIATIQHTPQESDTPT